MKNYLLISVSVLVLVLFSCKSGGERQAPPTRDTVVTLVWHYNEGKRLPGAYREAVKIIFLDSVYLYADTLTRKDKYLKKDSIYYYTTTFDTLEAKRRSLPMKDDSGKLITYKIDIPNDYLILDANWNIQKKLKEISPDTTKNK